MSLDRGVGLVTAAAGALLLLLTWRLPEAMLGDPAGPRLLPEILGYVLVALGLAQVARPGAAVPAAVAGASGRKRLWGGGGPRDGLRLTLVSALLFVYALVLTPLGYLVATAVVLLALLAIYDPGRWLTNVVVAVVFSAASYYLFHVLLGVYVPKGLTG